MGKTHDVYVGNGQTVTVTDSDTIRYCLDMDKLAVFFKEYPDGNITVGASGDWFWTARTIHGATEFEKIKSGEEYILRSSSWSRFADDDGNDYTIEMPASHAGMAFIEGYACAMSRINIWIPDLHMRLMKIPYEQLRPFGEKVDKMLSELIDEIGCSHDA